MRASSRTRRATCRIVKLVRPTCVEVLLEPEHVAGERGGVVFDHRLPHRRPGAGPVKTSMPGPARASPSARARTGEERGLVEVPERVAFVGVDGEDRYRRVPWGDDSMDSGARVRAGDAIYYSIPSRGSLHTAIRHSNETPDRLHPPRRAARPEDPDGRRDGRHAAARRGVLQDPLQGAGRDRRRPGAGRQGPD